MNSAQICFKCLGPIANCRTEDPETCWKQISWNLICKHCNSTEHHSLICPNPNPNPTPSHHTERYDDPRGGGEGGQGDQAGRGQERGGHQYNDNWQSESNTHSSNPNTNPNGADSGNSCNNPSKQKSNECQVQGPDISNANFLKEQDPDLLRAQFNIPRNAPINQHYVGETEESDIVNAFSSQRCPKTLKSVIQCVSQVELRLPCKQSIHSSCLLDTGSVLNFVSKALIDLMGRPKEEGQWAGSIKTVSGIKSISTPFHNICLVDVKGGFHIIRQKVIIFICCWDLIV